MVGSVHERTMLTQEGRGEDSCYRRTSELVRAIWRHRDGYISEQIVAACIAVFTEGPALAVLRSGRGVSGWNSYVQTSVHRAARTLEQPETWRAVEALATTLVFGSPMEGHEVHAIVDGALDTR